MARNIKIEPYFGIGNQLFQYMMAMALQERAGIGVNISGYNIPEFGLSGPANGPAQAFRVVIQNHVVPQRSVADLLALCSHIDIEINSLSCRMAYYEPFLDLYRKLIFPNNASARHVFGSDHLVINVRAGDIIAGIHPHYIPLPFSFYRQVIAETGLSPIFMGQVALKDDYCRLLREAFPNATFLESKNPYEDFCILSSATNILLSISTFAWLAAWLSNSAQRIYLPIAGLYNPASRPDIDLIPVNDPRYIFYDLELPSWDGSSLALSDIIRTDKIFNRLESPKLKEKFGDLLDKEGLQVFRPPLT